MRAPFSHAVAALVFLAIHLLAGPGTAAAQQFDIYRGLTVDGAGLLNLSPVALRFNPELSLFDQANRGGKKADGSDHDCYLRVTLARQPAIGASVNTVDPPGFTARRDASPTGHYSLSKTGSAVDESRYLVDLIKNGYPFGQPRYDMLIADGARHDCYEIQPTFQ